MSADEVLERMRCSGLRVTAARRAVVDALTRVGAHFTAEDLLAEGRTSHPALGRATVYRSLELCASLGFVRPVLLGGQEVTWIQAAGGHHHLVCTRCGACVEFEDCALGSLGEELAERHGFSVSGHLLELYGTCATCRAD